MKSYYISKRETWAKHVPRMTGSHFVDLPNGEIVMCAEFKLSEHQENFEAEDGVIAFPDLLDAPRAVGDAIAARLAAHGVKAEHQVFTAAMLLKQVHRGFDPRHGF